MFNKTLPQGAAVDVFFSVFYVSKMVHVAFHIAMYQRARAYKSSVSA